jgi:hypothetical protein
MEKDYLILKRASASRPSGEWNEEDYDVLAGGDVVGRIFRANAAPVGSPWMWTLAFDTTKIERPHMAMPRPERPRWRRSPRVGGGDERPIIDAARFENPPSGGLAPGCFAQAVH